jgi:ABC-2 type transport system permease protein
MRSVLAHVVRHEARVLAADRTLWLVIGVFGAMFVYALSNGAEWARVQRATIEEAATAEAERTLQLRQELRALDAGAQPASAFADPRAPQVLGGTRGARVAALPPGPLAALAVGQSDLLPYHYHVSVQSNDQTLLQNGELENPLNLMVGRFDLAFVLVYVLPLIVLAVSYNVLSAEKEQGTLALTLSQPVRLAEIVAGKVAFRAAVVLGLALGVSLMGAWATGGAGARGWCSGPRRWACTRSSGSRSPWRSTGWGRGRRGTRPRCSPRGSFSSSSCRRW